MGHTSCGAIKGACANVQLHHLTGLLKKIQPSVKKIEAEPGFNCKSNAVIDKIAVQNVHDIVHQIVENSSVIKNLLTEQKIGIVAAMQDLDNGHVTFFEDRSLHPGSPH